MNITQFYLSITVGLVLSLLIEETLGIVCGGAIVSGYLAMVCDDIVTMLLVFLIAMLVYLVVEFVLPRFVLLFGKRKFIACLLVGLVFKLLAEFLIPLVPVATLTFRGVGVIVPGLIANTSAKQGLHITLPAVLVGTYSTYLLVHVIMQFV